MSYSTRRSSLHGVTPESLLQPRSLFTSFLYVTFFVLFQALSYALMCRTTTTLVITMHFFHFRTLCKDDTKHNFQSWTDSLVCCFAKHAILFWIIINFYIWSATLKASSQLRPTTLFPTHTHVQSRFKYVYTVYRYFLSVSFVCRKGKKDWITLDGINYHKIFSLTLKHHEGMIRLSWVADGNLIKSQYELKRWSLLTYDHLLFEILHPKCLMVFVTPISAISKSLLHYL